MEDTPFIKLFSSPWNKYFYDVGRNEIVSISKELYNNLSLMQAGDVLWREMLSHPSEELSSLIEEGYLSDKRPSIIRHPYSDIFTYFLERKIDMLTLQVTQECNFRCKYCVYSEHENHNQRSHAHKVMAIDTAKAAIDFYINHSIDSESWNIGFYGGEPLLQFALIKRTVEYVESVAQGKLLKFYITTNGSLLTDEVIDFLAEHKFSLLISMDGSRNAHNKNRVFRDGTGTYDSIIENLEKVQERFPEYYKSIAFNTVLDPSNDFDAMIKLGKDLNGIPEGNIRFNYMETDNEQASSSLEFSEKDEYQSFMAVLALCGRFPENRLSSLGAQRLREAKEYYRKIQPSTRIPDAFAHGGPCIAGKSRLFVNVDGKFYPCERVNENDHMCIGDIKTGFNNERVYRLLNIGNLTSEQCKNCWAIRYCSICAKLCDDGNELSKEYKLKYCEGSRRMAEYKMRSIIIQNEMEVRCEMEASY